MIAAGAIWGPIGDGDQTKCTIAAVADDRHFDEGISIFSVKTTKQKSLKSQKSQRLKWKCCLFHSSIDKAIFVILGFNDFCFVVLQ